MAWDPLISVVLMVSKLVLESFVVLVCRSSFVCVCQLACTGKCESEPQNLFDSENDFKDGLLALLPLRIAGRTESVPVKENTNMLLY